MGLSLYPPPSNDTDWVTLSLQAGWAAVSGYTMQVRSVGSVCEVRGMVQWAGNATTFVQAITILPAQFRPATNKMLMASKLTTDSVAADIVVTPSGSILVPGAAYYHGTLTSGTRYLPVAGTYLLG